MKPGKDSIKKTSNPSTKAQAKQHAGKIKSQKIAKSGVDSRLKGHVSARGKRSQARRDSR